MHLLAQDTIGDLSTMFRMEIESNAYRSLAMKL